MTDVFNREVKMGDIVIPIVSETFNISNIKHKIGLIIGENLCFCRERSVISKNQIINIQNCILLDEKECNLIDVKTELYQAYKEYALHKLQLEQKLDNIGVGSVISTSKNADISNSYVYLGKLSSRLEGYIAKYKQWILYPYNDNEMQFENKYVYIKYGSLLKKKLDKKLTTLAEKNENINTEFDLLPYYIDLIEHPERLSKIVKRDYPYEIYNVFGKINLNNRVVNNHVLNISYYNMVTHYKLSVIDV